MSKTNIYILLLKSGKYYIGKSNDVPKRCIDHFNGNGSLWTKKYKPLRLEKTIENVSPFEEDKVTKEYMLKYGIENVRGGIYTQIELTDNQTHVIEQELRGAMDECLRCGEKGHFIQDCNSYIRNKDDEDEDDEDEDEDDEDEDEDGGHVCEKCGKTIKYECYYQEHIMQCKINKSKTCFRCGRAGHYSTTCYAKKHIKGYCLNK